MPRIKRLPQTSYNILPPCGVLLALAALTDYLWPKILFDEADLVILFWTALIMLWTAWETLGMKALQRDKLNLEYRPYLQLELSEDDNNIFQVTNTGYGIATAIHLENFMINKADPTTSVGFKGIQALSPGQSEHLQLKQGNLASVKEDLRKAIENDSLDKLLVSYYDLADWIYEAHFRARADYKGYFSILGTQKRVRKITQHEA